MERGGRNMLGVVEEAMVETKSLKTCEGCAAVVQS